MKTTPTILSVILSLSATVHAEERRAYFGETHMHTAFSLDAYIGGNRILPGDSYRFAKGEDLFVNGVVHNIGRPLDWAAVTDHAEYIGEMYSTMYRAAAGHDQEMLKQLRGLTKLEDKQQWFLKYVVENNRGTKPQHPEFFAGQETVKGAWQVIIDAAKQHNEPGVFTTLIGFEWSGAPKGANLHRNVLFRDDKVPEFPISYIDVNREDGLWDWMEGLEKQGMTPLAIPHNSNASKGMMFPGVDAKGDPIDLEYAKKREHFEPLIEMMQIKGNSEVHRKFCPTDEFANFENADSLAKFSGREIKKENFVRHGVIQGLVYDQKLGANPFKLGFVGGTDNHNGMMSDVAEDQFLGGHGPEDGTVERRFNDGVGGWIDGKDLSIGSITAVWAPENNRAAIWDALKRRETFATSGPRMKVRFFGGAGLPEEPKDAVALVEDGYAKGVPMGGTLSKSFTAPNFFVHAMKDPDGANLDRLQIIKGWVTEDGTPMERIYDVALSGGRQVGTDGRCKEPVGNTVDAKTAKFRNTIGAPILMAGWTDPEFDPAQYALYYLRALEIPTPRWTTYDSVRSGLPIPDGVPVTIQERAWSSPIWYTP